MSSSDVELLSTVVSRRSLFRLGLGASVLAGGASVFEWESAFASVSGQYDSPEYNVVGVPSSVRQDSSKFSSVFLDADRVYPVSSHGSAFMAVFMMLQKLNVIPWGTSPEVYLRSARKFGYGDEFFLDSEGTVHFDRVESVAHGAVSFMGHRSSAVSVDVLREFTRVGTVLLNVVGGRHWVLVDSVGDDGSVYVIDSVSGGRKLSESPYNNLINGVVWYHANLPSVFLAPVLDATPDAPLYYPHSCGYSTLADNSELGEGFEFSTDTVNSSGDSVIIHRASVRHSSTPLVINTGLHYDRPFVARRAGAVGDGGDNYGEVVFGDVPGNYTWGVFQPALKAKDVKKIYIQDIDFNGVSTWDGAKTWSGRSAIELVKGDPEDPATDHYITFEYVPQLRIGGALAYGYGGAVSVNKGHITLGGETPKDKLVAVIAHEVGHVLGFLHTASFTNRPEAMVDDNPAWSVMAWDSTGGPQSTPNDRKIIREYYGEPVKGAKTYELDGSEGSADGVEKPKEDNAKKVSRGRSSGFTLLDELDLPGMSGVRDSFKFWGVQGKAAASGVDTGSGQATIDSIATANQIESLKGSIQASNESKSFSSRAGAGVSFAGILLIVYGFVLAVSALFDRSSNLGIKVSELVTFKQVKYMEEKDPDMKLGAREKTWVGFVLAGAGVMVAGIFLVSGFWQDILLWAYKGYLLVKDRLGF